MEASEPSEEVAASGACMNGASSIHLSIFGMHPVVGQNQGVSFPLAEAYARQRSVVRMPYRFSAAESGPVRGVPETGEHTEEVIAEWTGGADLLPPAPTAGPALPPPGT